MSELIKLLREDVDLEVGYAVTRAADNKVKKEARIPLYPVIIGSLQAIPGFGLKMFI